MIRPSRLLVVLAAAAAALSAALAALAGSPLAFAVGGVRGPGLVSAAAAAALAAIALAARRPRRWLGTGLVLLTAVGCSLAHARGLDRPYEIEPLAVTSSGARIAGELYRPENRGPFPAVIVVPGSAGPRPVTRDAQFGLYRSAADAFARAGIAAVVYDRRGSGASSGDRRAALHADHAADVLAIRRALAARDDVRADGVGLWGISAGGWVAALAARDARFAFVVLVSAPSESEGRQRQHEWARRLARDGVAPDDVRRLLDARWRIWSYLASGRGYEAARAAYDDAMEQPWWPHLDRVVFPRWLASPDAAAAMQPEERGWFTTDMTRDPLEILGGADEPILAIYGGRDEIIPMPRSRRRMEAAADAAGGRITVRTYDRANHGLVELAVPPRFPEGYWRDTIAWAERRLGR